MTAPHVSAGGTAALGTTQVHRMGYGAMQLAGPHVFGPPADRGAAVAVLRRAVELGVDHLDTSDFYGPHVTNEVLREALHPFDGLTLVTKVGARRDADGGWPSAMTREELVTGVHDNLHHLGVEQIGAVNLRLPDDWTGSLEEPFTVLRELQEQGLVAQLGVSNVSAAQLDEALALGPVACVQNPYNLVLREHDALVDHCAELGVAFVPFFPLGGFSPLQHEGLTAVANRLRATPMQVALAWLLQRSPSILLIPGTSSVAHLEENIAATNLVLGPQDVAELDALA
jgi:pyridoxine 4-dehydrogenase